MSGNKPNPNVLKVVKHPWAEHPVAVFKGTGTVPLHKLSRKLQPFEKVQVEFLKENCIKYKVNVETIISVPWKRPRKEKKNKKNIILPDSLPSNVVLLKNEHS